ncbi:MAG: hypothetical protein H0V17_01475, partial [Deltaproteobacteria bacterium]|nr:hypothetical protein [Deltaproteobacteria bacterium]
MKSKLVGQRGLSAADQVLFGGRTEKLQWDYGGNMTGRLYAWITYAPNTTVPTITRSTANTDQGGERSRKHNFYNVAGLAGERSVSRKFSFDNKLTEIRYGDALPGSSENTLGKFHYDARGNPLQLGFLNINSGQPSTTIGVQTRNVAGLVIKRKSTTTGAMTFVESNWTYDKLGRVTSQVVQKGPGPVEVARQDLTYLGNDNPAALVHTIGASSKQFQFGYDRRHQITSANETTTPGYFTSSYGYGTAGRLTTANLAQTAPAFGSELQPRNVSYQYADADPERVTALIDIANAQPYASYQYDEAGNQVSRCYGADVSPCIGESVDFVYDGNDQLRRATKKTNGAVVGSEEYWYDGDGAR